jgi:hypothetical protein
MPTMSPASIGLGAKNAHDGGDRKDFESCAQHNNLAPLKCLGFPGLPYPPSGGELGSSLQKHTKRSTEYKKAA